MEIKITDTRIRFILAIMGFILTVLGVREGVLYFRFVAGAERFELSDSGTRGLPGGIRVKTGKHVRLYPMARTVRIGAKRGDTYLPIVAEDDPKQGEVLRLVLVTKDCTMERFCPVSSVESSALRGSMVGYATILPDDLRAHLRRHFPGSDLATVPLVSENRECPSLLNAIVKVLIGLYLFWVGVLSKLAGFLMRLRFNGWWPVVALLVAVVVGAPAWLVLVLAGFVLAYFVLGVSQIPSGKDYWKTAFHSVKTELARLGLQPAQGMQAFVGTKADVETPLLFHGAVKEKWVMVELSRSPSWIEITVTSPRRLPFPLRITHAVVRHGLYATPGPFGYRRPAFTLDLGDKLDFDVCTEKEHQPVVRELLSDQQVRAAIVDLFSSHLSLLVENEVKVFCALPETDPEKYTYLFETPDPKRPFWKRSALKLYRKQLEQVLEEVDAILVKAARLLDLVDSQSKMGSGPYP